MLLQGFPGNEGEADGRQQLAGMHPGHPDYEQTVRLYAQQQAQARGMQGGAAFLGGQVTSPPRESFCVLPKIAAFCCVKLSLHVLFLHSLGTISWGRNLPCHSNWSSIEMYPYHRRVSTFKEQLPVLSVVRMRLEI